MKAVCLSAATGGGHNAAAQSVAQALKSLGVQTQSRDCLEFAGKRVARAVEGAYVGVVRHYPSLFGKIYQAGAFVSSPRRKSPIYYANALYKDRVAAYLDEQRPDIVVCPHIFAAQTVSSLRPLRQLPLTAGVMTDYTCAPFWEEVDMDVFYTPSAALTEEYTAHGMKRERIVPLGIPANPACGPCLDVPTAKIAQGLSPDAPHVLLIGGSMGAGNLPDVLKELLTLTEEVRITVVCGSNARIRTQIEATYGKEPRLRVLGREQHLFELMDSADLVVTKPGGLTSTEVMQKRLPLVLIHPIEGVETRNAAFFEREGVALWAKGEGETAAMARLLLERPDMRAAQRDAQERLVSGTAAMDIARDLVARASAGHQGR